VIYCIAYLLELICDCQDDDKYPVLSSGEEVNAAQGIVHTSLRIIALIGALGCSYAAILLYPVEQGLIQNKLEDWWVASDDKQRIALSTATAFMHAVAALTSKLINLLFGETLWSFRTVVVSIWLSWTAISIGVTIFNFNNNQHWSIWDVVLVLGLVLTVRYSWARMVAAGLIALEALVFWIDEFTGYELYEALEERDVKYAIRLPANDNLQRNIRELLTRPVGRPSHQPVFRFKSFLYQAASWTIARRVVAKVEFHCGKLFPRVGFIVTNLELDNRAMVRFYNKRGTAEQWIKESKQAVALTRLSCHRFRANEVRLWLSLIAYNLGKLVAPAGVARADRKVVANQLAATVGQDRRTAHPTCALLLVAAGGESSHAAAVRGHAGEDRDAAVAGGIK
jgi:Transposase DDE domain group 1